MRDPKRLDEILKEIERIWKESPDLRLMQLLLNAVVTIEIDGRITIDHYWTEDDAVLEALKKTYK